MSALGAEEPATEGPRGRRNRISFADRLERTKALAGYTTADEQQIQKSRDYIEPHVTAVVEHVYDRLTEQPETASAFARPDGRVDRTLLEERSRSLQAWLRMAIEAPLDARFAAQLAGIGRAHTRRGGSPSVRVYGRYLLIAMSIVMSELTMLLSAALTDSAELGAAVSSWNKLLMIHLDLFLAVYGAAEGNPHWY
jgi:hypothetical protein